MSTENPVNFSEDSYKDLGTRKDFLEYRHGCTVYVVCKATA